MKNAIAAVLGLMALGLVAKAIFFSSPPPLPPSPDGPDAAPAAATGGAPATPAAPAAAAPRPGAPAGGQKAGPVNLDELAKGVEVVDFLYDQTSLARNPMNPLVGPQAVFMAAQSAGNDKKTETEILAQAELLAQSKAVTGIIWDKSFPVAVINDDVVAPGDVLEDGVMVQAIEPDRVLVKVGQTLVPLQLKKTEEQ